MERQVNFFDYIGQEVELISLPTDYSSICWFMPDITIGNRYKLMGLDGSNVIISTNDNKTTSIWYGRIKIV